MSAPPPYQNHPQQQPPYGYPQPPQAPQQPPRGRALQGLLTLIVVLGVFAAIGWYVYDYNTDPEGGYAKEQAESRAQDQKHNPSIGDCVKVKDPQGEPLPTVVDCASPEAEYKTADDLPGFGKECSAKFDYGIQITNSRGGDHTLCFTKV